MKTYSRTSLPDSITYNNKVYKVSIHASHEYSERKVSVKGAILVKVMHKNLRGRTDLHGKPYQPSLWIYIPEPKTTSEEINEDTANWAAHLDRF